MSLQDAQQAALAQYEKKAEVARQAREQASKARELSDATPDSDELASAAQKEEDKAKTAEKNEHLAALATRDTHKQGEEEGCVTRCVWTDPRKPPYKRRCLFDGHNHKENAIKYHVANERHWYNLRFHQEGKPRQRLEAALGFRYKPAPGDKAKDKKAGKKLELKIRMAAREDKNNPLVTASVWDMGMSGENFWSGSKKPWHHQAHHVIPTDALAEAFQQDMALLQQLKYNVHKGVNVIILPTQALMGGVYLLPAHTNSHRDYSLEVESRIRSVRNAAGKQQAKKDGHPAMSEAQNQPWKSQLEASSKSLRKLLRKTGLRKGLAGGFATVDDVFKTVSA